MIARTIRWTLALAAGVAVVSAPVRGADGARVNNLKVLSDKGDDVTTAENIVRSFAKPGMSEAERSRALWTAVVKYRHQAPPPHEYLAADWEAHDPVKIFNVYGYCMCCCSSAMIASLNRIDGREVRGRILNGHSVPEVRHGDAWHMFDASLISLFPRPADGSLASVDEISADILGWYAAHPGTKGNQAKIMELMRKDGWMGWKGGPPLLAASPFYRQGYLPAGTHGWDATMTEYARNPCEVYDYGYQVGHRALFSLRPGESLVREAGNRGLHVDRAETPDFELLKSRAPEGDLKYLKEFFPGYNGGVIGNGVHRYVPDLAGGGLAAGSEVYENLTSGQPGGPALRPEKPGKPGVAVIPMSSPYVYLGGRLRVVAVRRTEADRVSLSISTNNGRSFTPLWNAPTSGAEGQASVVELPPQVLRRYAYWLEVEISAATPGGAGLNALVLENDVQHAPRSLPRLARGTTTITVAADSDPTITTRSIVCRITGDPKFDKNETSSTMGLTFDNLRVDDGSCWWTGGTGVMTVPVTTPGDLVALRMSLQFRARDAKDVIRIRASTDGGTSWRDLATVTGPTPGMTRLFQFGDWPATTRSALLQFELTGRNTTGIFSLRIDADYRDPLAAAAPKPFRVVHRWLESGRPKEHVQVITALPSHYTIDAAEDPELVSVGFEMPARP
jgi:hypothetical protein